MSKQQKLASPEMERRKSKAGEIAGGATAICCCCPCTVMHVVFLTVYKLPVSLCKKVQHRRLDKKRKMVLSNGGGMTSRFGLTPRAIGTDTGLRITEAGEVQKDVVELDKEMWERFRRGGFGRSTSQSSTK